MCILEKLHLIPPTDLTRHWMQVEGIKRLSAPNVHPRVFAETGDLEFLGRHRDHWSWDPCRPRMPLFLMLSACRGGEGQKHKPLNLRWPREKKKMSSENKGLCRSHHWC